MSDPFCEAYARVVVEHALDVGPGDDVLIESTPLGEPLCESIHAHVLRAGGNPAVVLEPDDWLEAKLECASEAVLGTHDWLREAAYASVARRVKVTAPANTRFSSSSPPARGATMERARSRGMKTLIARDERGEARWLGALHPTEAAAQEAGMSLDDYRVFLARALRLDRQDPVAAWRCAAERQRRIQERLAAVRELRLRGPGTDLLVGVAGRRWISSAGRHNLPDGEVFTGPQEDVTEGTVAFAFPALWGGRATSGIRLRFAGGRCVDASADAGEEFLLAALDGDAGARTLGEFAFGLNEGVDRPTGSTLLDEKMGGTVHMALGNAYPATGGRNVSDLHWDLVCDLRAGGEVHADGELAYRDGAFLPGFLGVT